MPTLHDLAQVALVGVGATVVLDAWQWLLKRTGMPTSDYALVGRWAGHLARGQLAHASITRAEPVPHELGLGWLIHYAVGMAFAAVLVAIQGGGWLRAPSFVPALAMGVATVAVPLLLMQPAMGAGFAAAKTPQPWRNRLRSLVNHAVFGCGLYLAAIALTRAAP